MSAAGPGSGRRTTATPPTHVAEEGLEALYSSNAYPTSSRSHPHGGDGESGPPPPPQQQQVYAVAIAEQAAEALGDEADGAALQEAPEEERAFRQLEREAREALEAIAMEDADIEYHIADYTRTLILYRNTCQQRCMYREAHLVQQVIQNLKMEEETRHVRGLTEQQMHERWQLEEEHRDMFRAFHQSWNEKINRFEEGQLEQEVALLERQNEELLALYQSMQTYVPRNISRYSKQLVETRGRQLLLAEQKNYVGAQQAMEQGDQIELEDLRRMEMEKALYFSRKEQTLKRQHAQELRALQLRVESKRLLLERARKEELDVLLQKYINYRRGMENQQNIVRGKTGQLLLNHARNNRSDVSGTVEFVESAKSGVYGPVVQRRHLRAMQEAEANYQAEVEQPQPPQQQPYASQAQRETMRNPYDE